MRLPTRLSPLGWLDPITARGYVRKGLVSMWDGIENAGWGVHDPNATVWKDLIGNADMTLANNGATYSWAANALRVSQETTTALNLVGYTDGNSALNALLNAASGFTVEVVAQKMSSFTSSQDRWIDSNNDHPFMIQSDRTNGSIGCLTGNNTNILTKRSINTTKAFHVALTQDLSGGKVAYFNGQPYDSNDTAYAVDFTSIILSNRGGEKLRYCMRIYSCVLSASEIAANYAADVARFNLPTT